MCSRIVGRVPFFVRQMLVVLTCLGRNERYLGGVCNLRAAGSNLQRKECIDLLDCCTSNAVHICDRGSKSANPVASSHQATSKTLLLNWRK